MLSSKLRRVDITPTARHLRNFIVYTLFTGILYNASAQQDTVTKTQGLSLDQRLTPTNWFSKISIRGYAQVRYNRLFETNENLGCEQCDKSWGGNGGFFLRRMRLIFFGRIHERVYVYVQPELASSATTNGLNFGQLRDAYFDLALDKKGDFRFRVGQSKVPFGFENMQSSQNRLPLDRNDALNSGVANERDLGVFFYWAPRKVRDLYSKVVPAGLKGSGDYGVFGLGVYNGQTANRPENNADKHLAVRLSYPFEWGSQIIEPGIQGYTGKYTLFADQLSKGVKTKSNLTYDDQRMAGSFVLYPKPFGIQAEYNVGYGPEFNKKTDSIEVKLLQGGYATLCYMINLGEQKLYPFARYQYYRGGKKHELDARRYEVSELEIGLEWLPVKSFELVAMYTISSRRYEDFILRDNIQTGNLLRLQAQINF